MRHPAAIVASDIVNKAIVTRGIERNLLTRFPFDSMRTLNQSRQTTHFASHSYYHLDTRSYGGIFGRTSSVTRIFFHVSLGNGSCRWRSPLPKHPRLPKARGSQLPFG
jgi:hypothetical protein